MGLFSSETETYVSSSVANLAGDADTNFMAQAIVSGVLADNKKGLSNSIQSMLMNSTASYQKRFFNWAKDNYTYGMPTASIGVAQEVPVSTVYTELEPLLGLAENQSLQVISATIDDADFNFWAEHWIQVNRQDLIGENWEASFSLELSEVRISADGVSVATFPAAADLLWGLENRARKLLYISYVVSTKDALGLVTVGSPILITYRMGSGITAFDDLGGSEELDGEFFPVLPLRFSNKSIRHSNFEAHYDSVKTGFRKLTGSRDLESLLDDLDDHKDIDDVDYCFLVPGVVLNTEDPAGKRYIYNFFKSLIPYQVSGTQALTNYATTNSKTERWYTANSGDNPLYSHPLFGTATPDPVVPVTSSLSNEIRVTLPGLKRFDMRLQWLNITESTHIGNCRQYDGKKTRGLAKKGDIWTHVLERDKGSPPSGPDSALSKILWSIADTYDLIICHQYADYRYTKLHIEKPLHVNYVYDGEAVRHSAHTAFESDDESGFILPLHYPTLRNLGLAKGAQLGNASFYLVFNSYTRVTTKWYQKGFFKVVLMIGIVVLASFTGGASLGATVGLLGTNAAVGAALGASAATAALVGAAANAIAGAILATLVTRLSTAIFGDKIGAIIGTIVTFVAGAAAMNFAATGSFTVDWSSMLRVDNLMKLTDAVTGAYTQWLQADTAEIGERMNELTEDYQDQLSEIEDISDRILGMTGINFNPMLLTDAAEYFGESREAFLGRTMLTGSDIANLSMALIENFAEISLELPKAIS